VRSANSEARLRAGSFRVSASAASADHITPYDRFAWSDGEVEESLASGTQREELSAYFGAGEYRALAALARRARAARAREQALRVLIVPGIMGSQLGLLRPGPLPHDILWLDPLDIQRGRLAALRLPTAVPVVPLGVVMFSYLRLKLSLRARGFAAEFHDYDWRLPIAESGRALAERLRAAHPARLALVAHSMGGLVSRAALALPGTAHVERLVLLGTPNSGSLAAVQALRGTYAVVRKVARLAERDSAETLSEEVFNTFPSLYELLPGDAGDEALFDAGSWPASGPQPRAELLEAARIARAQLAPPDARFAVVAGVGQVTATGVSRRRGEFVYTLTRRGDGTVPVASAQLAGVRSFYARVAHSDLTRDERVAAAVTDLLVRGSTARLPARWASASRALARVSDGELKRSHTQKVDWTALSATQRLEFLQSLNEPPRFSLRVPPAAQRARRRRAGM
jgi:pimeloyl-ACP methyl ester carboxylesterase